MVRSEESVQAIPEVSAAPGSGVQPKAILLFSDGTGNSSAKLFKTNVWRLYEAVELGPAPPGAQVQIAFYDNGVGTSGFRPLALLGGIFGWGLKRNVLRLYTFLCRNYRKDDKIYAFGFSRGAFTIRILVALIARQGILTGHKDADLAYLVHDAYRDYCRNNFPRRWPEFLIRGIRGVRDAYIGLKRTIRGQLRYRQTKRLYEDVEFVGVWDTVSAYGGPFAELTRGIDDWVWPLSLPNYRLSARVRRARHALSLDDERDAFWPLLWDEHLEEEQSRNGGEFFYQDKDGQLQTGTRPVIRNRLRQVWFAGVHSDVGGGYPDESLSYTSLTWMMDELKDDLRFIPQFVDRAAALANPLGPIHDSRGGPAAYYRYQPRKIAAFLDPPDRTTVSLRDPGAKGDRDHGLLKRVLVHESVLARIASGVDNYAPSALPETFIPILSTGPVSRSALSNANLEALTRTHAERKCRYERQENEWDGVWKRRFTYFLTVFATLLLLALPWIPWLSSLDDICSDDRCFAPEISNTALILLPETFRGWLTPWAERPIGTLALLVVIMGLIWSGGRAERRFRDDVRQSWEDFRNGNCEAGSPPSPTQLRRWRESDGYQFALFDLKWRFLPLICGIGALVAILYAGVVLFTQAAYAVVEPHSYFCEPEKAASNPNFQVQKWCNDTGQDVASLQSYRLALTPKEGWNDGWNRILWFDTDEIPADPRGVTEETRPMMLGRPLKRVTKARWLQPVVEIRAEQTGRLARWQWLVGDDIELREVHFRPQKDGTYLSDELCSRRSGRVYLFANDAAPVLLPFLYWNNGGSAHVTVVPSRSPCKSG